MIIYILLCVAAYFVGSFPTGYIVARIKGIPDIRKQGSGTIGATNVARFLGAHYFFFVLLCDAGKAYLFLLIAARWCSLEELYLLSLVLFFGNTCSIFLGGRGGKGVATACGILVALQPVSAVPALLAWTICMMITKTVGISSLCAAFSVPLYAYYGLHDIYFFLWSAIVFFCIVLLHRKNVRAYF